MTIKELRKQIKITQEEASKITGVPLRTYKLYENDPKKIESLKYEYIVNKLQAYSPLDETHGVLELATIKDLCNKVFSEYDISYAILFGSYAKGEETESSDVDILISTDITGLKFYGLVEELRQTLKKRIDLLNVNQLENNISLTNEILKYGVRIYKK